jgi:hypothetical protein
VNQALPAGQLRRPAPAEGAVGPGARVLSFPWFGASVSSLSSPVKEKRETHPWPWKSQRGGESILNPMERTHDAVVLKKYSSAPFRRPQCARAAPPTAQRPLPTLGRLSLISPWSGAPGPCVPVVNPCPPWSPQQTSLLPTATASLHLQFLKSRKVIQAVICNCEKIQ